MEQLREHYQDLKVKLETKVRGPETKVRGEGPLGVQGASCCRWESFAWCRCPLPPCTVPRGFCPGAGQLGNECVQGIPSPAVWQEAGPNKQGRGSLHPGVTRLLLRPVPCSLPLGSPPCGFRARMAADIASDELVSCSVGRWWWFC